MKHNIRQMFFEQVTQRHRGLIECLCDADFQKTQDEDELNPFKPLVDLGLMPPASEMAKSYLVDDVIALYEREVRPYEICLA